MRTARSISARKAQRATVQADSSLIEIAATARQGGSLATPTKCSACGPSVVLPSRSQRGVEETYDVIDAVVVRPGPRAGSPCPKERTRWLSYHSVSIQGREKIDLFCGRGLT